MLARLAARVLQSALIIAFVAAATFALIHAAPGDPFSAALDSPSVPESVRAHLRAQYGLDRPIAEQFLSYGKQISRGNLGWSFSRDRPVAAVMGQAVPGTLLLMGTALALSFLFGISVALFQVARRGSRTDRAIDSLTLALASAPDFWFATLALLALSYWIPLFPVGGAIDAVTHQYLPIGARIADRLRHLALPALTLALLHGAGIARFQKSALLDVLPSDFIRTARGKGAGERSVLIRHAFRNSLLTLITLGGLSLPALLTGAVFIEKVFSWPGMGLTMIGAIGARDYPLVIGCVILGSVLVVAGSLLADALYAAADPRLRRHR